MKLDVAAASKQRCFWQNRDARLASITARHGELNRAAPVAASVEFTFLCLVPNSCTQVGVLVSSGAEGFVAVAEFELVLKLPYQVGS
ncbi:hypothetical protein P8452_55002 [Trifolium repens]|nr:hypothetical protein P8452_55001 [Trifolium repens]WJX70951.1 hypothetical protein P8452_55002 [Trifolium repens]